MANIREESMLKNVRVFKKDGRPEDPETSKGLIVLGVNHNTKTLMPTATHSSAHHHHAHVQQITQSQGLLTYEFTSFDTQCLHSRQTMQDLIDSVVNSDQLTPETSAELGRNIAAYILTRFNFSTTSSMIMIIVEVEVTRIVSFDNDHLELALDGGKQVQSDEQGCEYSYPCDDRIEDMSGYLSSSGEEEKDSTCGIYICALGALMQFLDHQESMGAPEEFEEVETVMGIQEFKGGDDDDGWVDGCPICLEGFAMGMEVAKLPCYHTFHKSCVFGWLVKSSSCPMCRCICVALV